MREKLIREWKKVFVSDLSYITYELKELLKPKTVIILEGPLGSGKTTFAKNFIEDDSTFSPSYSVLSETKLVLHADFYRLKEPAEILHLELPLYLEDKQYFLVEWGKKYFRELNKELPESFSTYLLEISVNDTCQSENDGKASFSRNFALYELAED